MLAITDLPSTGLGYEIATMIEAREGPLLAVAHTDALVTDLILGIPRRGFRFARYRDLLKDVPPLVYETLAKIQSERRGIQHYLPGFERHAYDI